jgi:hypothetical protein
VYPNLWDDVERRRSLLWTKRMVTEKSRSLPGDSKTRGACYGTEKTAENGAAQDLPD